MACILLWSSAVRVHDSQAYRKMDVTRECFSRILRQLFVTMNRVTYLILRAHTGTVASHS